jgi:hypothetical protein
MRKSFHDNCTLTTVMISQRECKGSLAMFASNPEMLGLPVSNKQETTLNRRPARTERAMLRTVEVLAHLEGVLALGVDVLVTAG